MATISALIAPVGRCFNVIPTEVHGRMRPEPNGAGLSSKAIMGEIATGEIYLSVTTRFAKRFF